MTGTTGPAQEPGGLGSAAEEAAKLLAAAEQWVRGHGPHLGGLLDDQHVATGSPECSVCPVCQTIGALRQVRPETVAHLLDAGASLVAALRSVLAPTTAGGASARHVQHIDLDVPVVSRSDGDTSDTGDRVDRSEG
jgi:hypothetical protein